MNMYLKLAAGKDDNIPDLNSTIIELFVIEIIFPLLKDCSLTLKDCLLTTISPILNITITPYLILFLSAKKLFM